MQGRLLPRVDNRIQAFPSERWPEEFPLARQLGFDSIEFIFDADDSKGIESHPLLEKGCRSIAALVEKSGVSVRTICADYFMKHPFHRDRLADAERSQELLSQLVSNCLSLGVTDIVVPCVDQSRLESAHDCQRLVQRLRSVVSLCEDVRVNLALESDLSPGEFKELLDYFESPRVTVNYDVGNSASLGYNSLEDWEAYGERISSVHIKDRLLGGSTVPLGTGSAKFDDFFHVAREKNYQGLFVIQGARGADDMALASQYKRFVEQYLKTFYGS